MTVRLTLEIAGLWPGQTPEVVAEEIAMLAWFSDESPYSSNKITVVEAVEVEE